MSIDSHAVGLETQADLLESYTAQVQTRMPPLFDLEEGTSPGGPRLIHVESTSRELEVDVAQERMEVRWPREELQGGRALFFLAEPLLEQRMQREGFLTAHAACVALGERGVLLLGKTGAGKTSLVLELCRRFQARVMGNDLCVIGMREQEPWCLRGTRFLLLRKASIERNHPELLPLFAREQLDPWSHKVHVLPGQLGLDVGMSPVRISHVFFVHVDNAQAALYRQRADTLVHRLFLHENFSRYIRMSVSTLLTGSDLKFSGYLPSFDAPELFARRVPLMEALLEEKRAAYVSGPLRAVSEYIHQRLL